MAGRRHRGRHGRRTLLVISLVTPLVLATNASLASNTVPTTSIANIEVRVRIATELAAGTADGVADQPDQHRFSHVTATLTAAGVPISGRQVTFSAGGSTICTATTGADGVAACPDNVTVPGSGALPTGFTSVFAGDGPLQQSTSLGAVVPGA